MADNIGNKAAHDYHLDIAPVQDGFYEKGAVLVYIRKFRNGIAF